jgi:hypothetical protein
MKTFKQIREDAAPVNVAGVPGPVTSMQGSPTMAGIDKILMGGTKALRRKPLAKFRKK